MTTTTKETRRHVQREQATVYKTTRRRYFTKQAAYLDAARELIKAKGCDCEPAEWDHGSLGLICDGIACAWHEENSQSLQRLARWLERRDAGSERELVNGNESQENTGETRCLDH